MERRKFVKGLAVGTIALMANIDIARAQKGLHRLINKKSPSILEKKHVPLIVAPNEVKKGQWFNVEVRVGFQIEHPSTPGHWIEEITLLVNGKKVTEIENETGGLTSPNGHFNIRLNESATLEAIADCNLHGKWISEPVKIKVV